MRKPDRSNKKPIYQQIAEDIEHRISCGEFPPGSLLPSERKLAEQLGVNRSTVVQAYDELRASGIVEREKGSGTRVSKHKWGVAPKQAPNWKRYVEGSAFLPNLPAIRRIRGVLRRQEPCIDFASGELSADLFPNESVRELMRQRSFQEQLGYEDPQGFLPLRESLVRFLKTYAQTQTTASSLLITSGSQQSLYLITQCLLSPGDAVAIEDPSYCYSLPMFQSAGLRIFRLPVDRHGMNPHDVTELHKKHRIKMIFVNPNFQNPTGTVLTAERRLQLLDIAGTLGIPIVEDDPFSLTALDGCPPPTLKSLDTAGNVLYIGSFSKIAASGLRIGWLAAPQAVIDRLTDARQQMDFGLSSIPQWIVNELIEDAGFDLHLRRLQQSLLRKRDEMIAGLARLFADRMSFSPPRGGLNMWCALHRPVDAEKLLQEAIKRGVLFVPGSVYGSDHNCLRLSFARPQIDEIGPGLQILREALDSCSS